MRHPLIPLLAVAALLGGCAAQTMLITNDKASESVKGRSFKSYKEVLLVPPRADPRNLVPRVKSEIEAMGFKVSVLDPARPIDGPQGTGFVIGREGWMLTAAHVMAERQEATVTLNGKRLLADLKKIDKKADLALLKLREPLPEGSAVLAFRAEARPAAMGEDVFTIGYPLAAMLGNSARMSRGLLSATAGLRDNPDELQVSAEIQPGNSGGPLLDKDGNVIGLVHKTINPGAVAQATGGALPQNINFAIKARPLFAFLKDADPQAQAGIGIDKGGGLESAAKAVAKVQAGIVAPPEDRRDKMVVRFNYVSIWDVWYRFRVFVLIASDYETREGLFAAGQGRDNLVSNEEVVIKDTLDQFRKAIASR